MIELRDAGLAYGSVPVLSDINCILGRNEFVCIIGENGCGKSTLLKAAAGLAAYTGSIRLDDKEIRLLPRKERAKRVSYLPQTRPVPVMDVKMLIAHGRYPHLGLSKTLSEKDKMKIAHAAAITGITHLLDRELSALSGGERQRAYIAMMVAQDADIMLLDEPTTYLDIRHQLEVMELLKNLHQRGKGIVMAAHDLPQAFSYATRVLLISDGSVAAAGRPDELCRNPVLEAALGVAVNKTEDTAELYSFRMTKVRMTKGVQNKCT